MVKKSTIEPASRQLLFVSFFFAQGTYTKCELAFIFLSFYCIRVHVRVYR